MIQVVFRHQGMYQGIVKALEYLRTLSLKFRKARTKIEVVLRAESALLAGQTQDNFNFGPSFLKS